MTPSSDPKRVTPKAIDPKPPEGGLRIVWADAHDSLLPLVTLRRACPCATCRHEAEGEAKPDPTPSKPSGLRIMTGPTLSQLALSGVSGVGRYALQLHWSDGHDTGIYPFDLLRSLCPCGRCGEVG